MEVEIRMIVSVKEGRNSGGSGFWFWKMKGSRVDGDKYKFSSKILQLLIYYLCIMEHMCSPENNSWALVLSFHQHR